MTAFQLGLRNSITRGDPTGWLFGETSALCRLYGPDTTAMEWVKADPNRVFQLALCASPHRFIAPIVNSFVRHSILECFKYANSYKVMLKDDRLVVCAYHISRKENLMKASVFVEISTQRAWVRTVMGDEPIHWELFLKGIRNWEHAVGQPYARNNGIIWDAKRREQHLIDIDEAVDTSPILNMYPRAVQQYALSWYNNIAGK